jgi:hypothetical protein
MERDMQCEAKQKILKLFKKQPILANFATVTGKKSWVGYVMITMAPQDLKIRFASCIDSRKVKHISKWPE